MRRAATLAFALLALTSCAGGDEQSIDRSELRDIVLQPSDLPAIWVRFDFGRQLSADTPQGDRASPRRFGREEGWKARYRRPGSPSTTGPLVIESRVDLFSGDEGAEDDFAAYEREFERAVRAALGSGRLLPPPELGEAAAAMTHLQAGTTDVRFFTLAWRYENVTASLLVNGFEGRIALEDVLRLARSQQARIARVASK